MSNSPEASAVTSNPLYSLKSGTQLKKAILVGNGAVANGWEPARSIFSWGHSAEHQLAYFAANSRVIRHRLLTEFVETNKRFVDEDRVHSLIKSEFEPVEEWRTGVANAYCLASAEKTIFLKKEFIDFIEPFRKATDTAVITTNWDELLIQHGLENIVHLHGRASVPQSVVLPTELISDGFPLELLSRQQMSQDCLNDLGIAFRGASRSWLQKAEELAFDLLERADELIVYGLALNSYDSELMQVLKVWNWRLPRAQRMNGASSLGLTIVNPSLDHTLAVARFLGAKVWKWVDPTTSRSFIIQGDADHKSLEKFRHS